MIRSYGQSSILGANSVIGGHTQPAGIMHHAPCAQQHLSAHWNRWGACLALSAHAFHFRNFARYPVLFLVLLGY